MGCQTWQLLVLDAWCVAWLATGEGFEVSSENSSISHFASVLRMRGRALLFVGGGEVCCSKSTSDVA